MKESGNAGNHKHHEEQKMKQGSRKFQRISLSTRKGLLRWHNESARTQRAIETYLMWWGMEQVFQEEVKKKKVGGRKCFQTGLGRSYCAQNALWNRRSNEDGPESKWHSLDHVRLLMSQKGPEQSLVRSIWGFGQELEPELGWTLSISTHL